MEPCLKEILSSGGDERIFINENSGTNKYHLNPVELSNLVNRGSCTSGNLNRDTNEVAKKIDINDFSDNFDMVVRNHADAIKRLYSKDGSGKFEVFFAPSGSDLVYYPLLFSRLLFRENNPENILTCPEELGSGSQIAAQGKYYCSYNQFGEYIKKDSLINNNMAPKIRMLPARDANGYIIDNNENLKKLIQNNPDAPKIVNLVYGSKSGIEENLYIIGEINQPSILWTVDLCQFRNKKDLIEDLLDKGVILMITGSKFYQSPPFCGALLVPQNLCKQLAECDATSARDFDKIFTQYDIPECLPKIRKQFKPLKNIGLHLRWECALYEMEELDKLGEEKIHSTILHWNKRITDAINSSQVMELMPDTELTNNSIISFRIKYNDHYFDESELKCLFEEIVTTEFNFPDAQRKIFIGQPVHYESGSFLRLAIGSYDVRQFIKTGDTNFQTDLEIIKIIESEIEKFYKSEIQ